MRASFPPPPSRDELAELPIHVLLRDHPELLALFREEGPDPVRRGAERLKDAAAEPGTLLDRIEAAIAWRRAEPGA